MDISDRYALLQSAMAASERIFELLDHPTEARGGQINEAAEDEMAIEFDHVFFKYDPDGADWILEDVSFRVESGHSLALVGATGSGKTTIVNLLCRFYEIQQGTVRVDGVDVRDWDLHALRRRIGIVQQDVFLFTGNVADNIRLGEKQIETAQVEQVARYVNADGFVGRLPNGFNQQVAEGGASLSSGQRQLLSFARALAFDPHILVLDEATSNIDTETEQLIQDAMSRLMRERTSVVIAHRLSTIRNADQILVLHHGRVREEGRHDDLIRQDGIYARLYRLHYGADQNAAAELGTTTPQAPPPPPAGS
jgi:ABC-type multidrug transport system fused ATPase/permease subunit